MIDFWSHDFGGPGGIRSRRPHRGRAAIKDASALGNAKYQSTYFHKCDKVYHFSGEPNYKPIVYRSVQPKPDVTEKRKATSPAEEEKPKKRAHNQYTPKEQLVKKGAPSDAKGQQRYRARINTFLRRSPSPPWVKNRAKLYGGIAENARAYTASASLQGFVDTAPSASEPQDSAKEVSLWMEPDDSVPGLADTSMEDANANAETDEEAESEEEFPFTRGAKGNTVAPHRLPVKTATSDWNASTDEQALSAHSASSFRDLASANQTIEQQKAKIDGLQDALSGAKDAIELLKEEVSGLKEKLLSREDDGEDEAQWQSGRRAVRKCDSVT